MKLASLISLPALFLFACAHYMAVRSPVFLQPERFLNQTVRVCGYMIDNFNIVESQDRDDVQRDGGLSIVEKGPLNTAHRGRICVEGEIVYLGCETGQAVCFDTAFDYGLRIRTVIPPAQR